MFCRWNTSNSLPVIRWGSRRLHRHPVVWDRQPHSPPPVAALETNIRLNGGGSFLLKLATSQKGATNDTFFHLKTENEGLKSVRGGRVRLVRAERNPHPKSSCCPNPLPLAPCWPGTWRSEMFLCHAVDQNLRLSGENMPIDFGHILNSVSKSSFRSYFGKAWSENGCIYLYICVCACVLYYCNYLHLFILLVFLLELGMASTSR